MAKNRKVFTAVQIKKFASEIALERSLATAALAAGRAATEGEQMLAALCKQIGWQAK